MKQAVARTVLQHKDQLLADPGLKQNVSRYLHQ